MKKLEDYVLSIPDFPEKGIIFRDVTSVLQDADGLRLAVDTMQDKVKDLDYDVVVGPESRGFIFGMPIAYNNRKPFVLFVRRESCPEKQFPYPMIWNMARQPLRCTRTASGPDRRY